MRLLWGALLACATTSPAWAQTTTLYLCKGYGGGQFWSQSHCRGHSAVIDRMVSVPSTLPFDQQVAMAQAQRQSAELLQAPPVSAAPAQPVVSNKSECQALENEIKRLDDMARRPQSGQTQDWISGERRAARDRQFRIRC